MKKVLVLGGGLVGRPMALDLHESGGFAVTVADYSDSAIQKLQGEGISTIKADLSDLSKLESLISGFDLFINAVPGSLGFKTLEVLAGSGKAAVDIAFYADDPRQLDEIARASGSCIICDMGVAPGMSHLLSGYAASKLSPIDDLRILVGGLPVQRSLPWQYKAVFSPSDVIEEYTRTARLVRDGKIIEKEALSESELIGFEGIGTLEAFNSDGLRTLAYTISAKNMVEKTLRYPGHIDAVKLLRDSGFFDTKPIQLSGNQIIPLELSCALLFEQWKLKPGEADLTVMRIEARGSSPEGQKKTMRWDLLDRYDTRKGIHSMARTTGYAATAALRMIAAGLFTKPGIHMPEYIGAEENLVKFMLSDMEKRGIVYHFIEQTVN